MNNINKIASRVVTVMVYKRSEYKNKIQSHLTGAIVEFYKARLATKIGQTKWVKHWSSEVKTLVENKLVYEILHAVRGFKDRRKAYDEAIKEFVAGDRSYKK